MGNTCTQPIAIRDFSLEETRSTSESVFDEKTYYVPQHGKINILSYNIFIRPPFVSNNGEDYKDERLKEFLKLSYSYDIICLQEMFGSYSNRRSDFIEQARKLGFNYHAKSPRPQVFSSLFIDAGLLILSRFPIETFEFCPFNTGLGADYYVQKGVLYVKIRIGNSTLHLYTTHTQATYDEAPKYFIKRSEQLMTFQKFVKKTLQQNNHDEDDLVLLTGDFNVDGRSYRKFDSKEITSVPTLQELTSLQTTDKFTEYEALISCLSENRPEQIEDLLYKKHKEHPITYGDFYVNDRKEIKPIETVLTHPACLCANESLDYIFKYTPDLPNKSLSLPKNKQYAKSGLSVIEESATVEKFLIHGHDFEQLSDHYGVKVTLQYTKGLSLERYDSETTTGSSSDQSALSGNLFEEAQP